MFTGIVEELGQVVALEDLEGSARLAIHGPLVTSDASRGDSIAVSGVCLTVTGLPGDGTFTADVMGETLQRSGLGALRPGSQVNLERPMRLDGRLGGHLVQGHADGTGTILARRPAGRWEVVRISVPPALARFVVEKGSVAVDGVSLTISALSGQAPALSGQAPALSGQAPPDAAAELPVPGEPAGREAPPGQPAGQASWIEVSLIPETLERTTLGGKQPGEVVNLEVDMIGKYVERLLVAGARA